MMKLESAAPSSLSVEEPTPLAKAVELRDALGGLAISHPHFAGYHARASVLVELLSRPANNDKPVAISGPEWTSSAGCLPRAMTPASAPCGPTLLGNAAANHINVYPAARPVVDEETVTLLERLADERDAEAKEKRRVGKIYEEGDAPHICGPMFDRATLCDADAEGLRSLASHLREVGIPGSSLRSGGEPVAWRVRLVGHDEWSYHNAKPQALAANPDVEVEPLFARSGSGEDARLYASCCFCGRVDRIIERPQSLDGTTYRASDHGPHARTVAMFSAVSLDTIQFNGGIRRPDGAMP